LNAGFWGPKTKPFCIIDENWFDKGSVQTKLTNLAKQMVLVYLRVINGLPDLFNVVLPLVEQL